MCMLLSVILALMIKITLYTPYDRFFLKHKALFDGRVVLMTKNVYDFTVKLMYSLSK